MGCEGGESGVVRRLVVIWEFFLDLCGVCLCFVFCREGEEEL